MRPKFRMWRCWEQCRRRPVQGHRHSKGTTFGERDGPDEERHWRNEGFHEKSEPCGWSRPQDRFPLCCVHHYHPLPSKFKMPTLDSYDGMRDPCDLIATFKKTMHLQGVLDEIMRRAFPTTLKGPVRVCFSKLPPNTITSFQEGIEN